MKKFIDMIVALINIVPFMLWWSLIRIEKSHPDKTSYVYDSIAINFTILEIILFIISVFIGVVAFFGYQGIKDGAINTAREVADEAIRKYILEKEKQSLPVNDIVNKEMHRIDPGSKIERAEEIGKE